MLLYCYTAPTFANSLSECRPVGASEKHEKAVEMAYFWCKDEPKCVSHLYIQKVEVQQDFERVPEPKPKPNPRSSDPV
jgi:hypothetical protein